MFTGLRCTLSGKVVDNFDAIHIKAVLKENRPEQSSRVIADGEKDAGIEGMMRDILLAWTFYRKPMIRR